MEDIEPAIATIMQEEAERTGFSIKELRSRGQRRDLAAARQYAIWRCVKETKASAEEIAWSFNRERDAVYYSVGVMEGLPRRLRGAARKPEDPEPPPIVFQPPIMPILKEEATRAGLTVEQFIGHNRAKRFYEPRQYAMWRAKKETGRSFSEIGRVFKRDHSPVMHAYQKIEATLAGAAE